MQTQIDTNSNLYLKRLTRELNAQENGFYAPVATMNVRCNKARFRQGEIECHSLSCSPAWFKPVRNQFEDCYGREIVATRKA